MIVPHFDDLLRLDTCLNALESLDYPSEMVEIIVSDNCSPCGAAAVEATIRGRARLVLCEIRGAGMARNAGIAAATHNLLAFTDSDCVVAPQWLRKGIAALASADLIGGKMEVTTGAPGQRSGAEVFEQVFAFDNRRYVLRLQFSVTANLFTRADLFSSIGGFKGEVSEDVEWCRRAVGAGYSIAYEPCAIVGHPARSNWHELKRKWDRIQRESLALEKQQVGGRLRWVFRSWLLPASIFFHAPRVIFSADLKGPAERVRALATLIRIRIWRFVHAQAIGFGRR